MLSQKMKVELELQWKRPNGLIKILTIGKQEIQVLFPIKVLGVHIYKKVEFQWTESVTTFADLRKTTSTPYCDYN